MSAPKYGWLQERFLRWPNPTILLTAAAESSNVITVTGRMAMLEWSEWYAFKTASGDAATVGTDLVLDSTLTTLPCKVELLNATTGVPAAVSAFTLDVITGGSSVDGTSMVKELEPDFTIEITDVAGGTTTSLTLLVTPLLGGRAGYITVTFAA